MLFPVLSEDQVLVGGTGVPGATQVCYIREKAEKGAPDGICCAEGSVRFRTQMSENSRLESIKGVTELKSNKPAKVKSTFEAINFFKKIVKFVP